MRHGYEKATLKDLVITIGITLAIMVGGAVMVALVVFTVEVVTFMTKASGL